MTESLRSPKRWLLAALVHAVVARAALRQFNFTIHSEVRSPGKYGLALTLTLPSYDGYEREVFLINGQQPGPAIDVDEGDTVEVFVKNDLKVETALHWHGLLQRGTPQMDGVPGVTQVYAILSFGQVTGTHLTSPQDPIPPGGNFTYRFSTTSEYGFYWYHSHFRAYYNDAIRGPLLVRPAASRTRPFGQAAATDDNDDDFDAAERAALLEAEADPVNVMLNDWTHETSDVVFERYLRTGAFPSCVDSILANGRGRVECLPRSVLEANLGPAGGSTATQDNQDGVHPELEVLQRVTTTTMLPRGAGASLLSKREMHDMDMNKDTSATMPTQSTMPTSPSTPPMNMLSPRGCTLPMMFKPGFDITSLPAETCTNTSSSLLTIPANTTRGWLALNLVNSGAVSALRVSLDGHSMMVYAADGLYVQPQQVQVLHMELGQRYSVMVKLDQEPGSYNLRYATYPSGDMQQVLQGRSVVVYDKKNSTGDGAVDNAMNWMQLNGSAVHGATVLDAAGLGPFESNVAPPSGPAGTTLSFEVNQTDITTWALNSEPFQEPDTAIINRERSSGWTANTTYHLPLNTTVDIILHVSNRSMDQMGHPLHLHGHKFWVLGSGSGPFPYGSVTEAPADAINLVDPPYRDTAALPPQGWLALRYVTDNPGAWIFHCHLQWHVVSGMAVVLVEGLGETPSTTSTNDTPTTPATSEATHDMAGSVKRVILLATGFITMFWANPMAVVTFLL
ncbi:MICOS complex subunit mic19 [Purpureocillium lavendulum]|uniref:MICOS complex subunit mic19 n=1 Tax=Purpureocillium lavendulum TaxID=1247861 RepID=A0AB34G7Z5_9HYPO|nr:MICOS complex subunit mic19 [Purpureocillium lavendulum]